MTVFDLYKMKHFLLGIVFCSVALFVTTDWQDDTVIQCTKLHKDRWKAKNAQYDDPVSDYVVTNTGHCFAELFQELEAVNGCQESEALNRTIQSAAYCLEPYVTEEMETGEKTALMASLQIQEVYCFLVNEGKCREGIFINDGSIHTLLEVPESEPIPDNDIGAIVEALNMMCELGCCILG